MSPEEITKEKNDKILLKSLRNDIIEASTALSQIKEELRTQCAIVEEKRSEVAILNELKLSVMDSIGKEKENLKNSYKDLEKAENRSKKELEILKTQKKEAMSELRRLNDWNFTALEEKKALEVRISQLTEIEKKKKEYISDISFYEDRLLEIKEKQRIVLIDIKLSEDTSEALLDSQNKKLERMKEEVAVLEVKKTEAETLLARAIIERDRIKVDLEIYEKRIRNEYSKVFNGKEIKLKKSLCH